MTDDLSIDHALALAIGWKEERLQEHVGQLWARANMSPKELATDGNFRFIPNQPPFMPWRCWSHLDPAVIWPIAERFDCFPFSDGKGKWYAALPKRRISELQGHANPATAVALAVIAAHGGKK